MLNFVKNFGPMRNVVLIIFAALCCIPIGVTFGVIFYPLTLILWLIAAYTGFYFIETKMR